MENLKMDKLFESYTKRAAQYLNEDDEELDDVLPGDEDLEGGDEDLEGGDGDDEEVLELDLANPVCPSCGAELIPVGGEIDTEETDEDGNPIYDEDEADAIDLLQGLGYIVYKPVEDDEDLDDEDIDGDELDDVDEDDLEGDEDEDL